jgi:trans-2-enoyl-CoA reductase
MLSFSPVNNEGNTRNAKVVAKRRRWSGETIDEAFISGMKAMVRQISSSVPLVAFFISMTVSVTRPPESELHRENGTSVD